MIFPSTAGTWRDPTTSASSGAPRGRLGVPEVTTHSFRKTVADLIDAEGCQPASAQISWVTAMYP